MQAIEIIVIVFAIFIVTGTIAYNIVRKKKGKSGCGCDCKTCKNKCDCHK